MAALFVFGPRVFVHYSIVTSVSRNGCKAPYEHERKGRVGSQAYRLKVE